MQADLYAMRHIVAPLRRELRRSVHGLDPAGSRRVMDALSAGVDNCVGATIDVNIRITASDYPPALSIQERGTSQTAGVQRTDFQYNWGTQAGFPRHEFSIGHAATVGHTHADNLHLGPHCCNGGPAQPFTVVPITNPDTHPTLVSEFIQWIQRSGAL